MISVLFVCMGNICRSPTAEGVFRKLHEEHSPELKLRVDSAGTHAYHIGQPPDRRAQAAALRRGIDISGHRGRLVEARDFLQFDYVLAMDHQNLRNLRALQPAGSAAVVGLLLEFAEGLELQEVPDPYYGERDGFEQVLDLVEVAGRGLLLDIRKRYAGKA